MIDEAVGKILGMAMAYGASAMGMFLAYVNYRKRIVKAERVLSTTAWVVIGLTALAAAGAVIVVAQIAAAPAPQVAEAVAPAAPPTELPPSRAPSAQGAEREQWPWIGVAVPGLIFLVATVVTAGLHRHFSAQSH